MPLGASWGRYPGAPQVVIDLTGRQHTLPDVVGPVLAYGNGRSYGDSCQNTGGTLLHTRRLDHFIEFDPVQGRLRCEAGVQLADILRLVVPRGWFLPVSPGTRYVTVGGAIANDVHGKNHHVAGSFGRHVLAFELLRSNAERILCTPVENADWFCATIGGLGLTGLVCWAELQLRPIESEWIDSETIRFGRLQEFFELSCASALSHEYTVAWVDCTAGDASLGRGLFTRGNHADKLGASHPAPRAGTLAMPVTPPISLVNKASVRLFNNLHWRRQWRRSRRCDVHFLPFFYPLDAIAHWNRMYGPRGFLQYQCVVPPAVAADAIAEILKRIARSGQGSFLAVLKQFGEHPPVGMLSFPRAGTTLALDFPNHGARVLALLESLDTVVSQAGGAVYPAKDARMSGSSFKQYFPAWPAFQAYVDPRFSSDFWRRVKES